MKKLDLAEIKKLNFEVLCAIGDICEKYEIPYSLTGGTLLGAVRHQGFIPWDDDIDIMMTRPDYERFIRVATKENPVFELFSAEKYGSKYAYLYAKACYKNTVIKEKGKNEGELPMGVFVDIFPVDGIGNSYRSAKFRCKLFKVLHGLKIMSNWKEFQASKLRNRYYEPFRYGCFLMSRVLGNETMNNAINRFLRMMTYEDALYVGRLVGDFGSKEVMKKEIFEEKTIVKFEGRNFSAIKNYDTFLSNLYGNYMQLPPVEKRVTHHEYEAYLMEDEEEEHV